MKHLKLDLLQAERIAAVTAITVAILPLYKDHVILMEAASIEGADVYTPNSFKVFVALLGFIGIFLGTFLKHRFWLLMSFCSIACPLYIFTEWYIESFRFIHNENYGWEAKMNKIGLIGAEWEHVIMLCITLFLFTSLTFRMIKLLHGASNSR